MSRPLQGKRIVQRADPAHIRFVRALLPDRVAELSLDGRYRAGGGRRVSALDAPAVAALVELGVLVGGQRSCCPATGAAGWVRRQLLDAGTSLAEPAAHASEVQAPTESSLARLQSSRGTPFLSPHQIEAGERFRQLFERAQLRARVTMSYDAARTASGGTATAHDLTDMAADARRRLSRIIGALPADCAGVVLDVCGFEKGLQLVESERQWPRRSAKLVLRIGLEQLARHFGLAAVATGAPSTAAQAWMGEGGPPPMFAMFAEPSGVSTP
jgi:hypothetical protein